MVRIPAHVLRFYSPTQQLMLHMTESTSSASWPTAYWQCSVTNAANARCFYPKREYALPHRNCRYT